MSDFRPYPAELVGDDDYLDALDRQVSDGRFPDPDPNLVPELTGARFVAEAARAVDESAFADRIDERRGPVFDPLHRFDVVARFVDERARERVDDADRSELLSEVGLQGEVSFEAEPE